MCGRTAQGLAPAQIRQQLEHTLPSKPADAWIGEDKYRTSYNVAPTRYQPVVRADPKTKSYVVHMMRWGLIPRHSKAMPDYSSVLKSINARDDSLFMGPTGKPMFSHSKNHKRCLLLAEGFYEWRRRGKERVPFYTKRRDGRLMLMAAIYDVAQIQGAEEPLYTYATITTNASPQLDWLHDRMPVLIPNNDHEKIRTWLDPTVAWNSTLEAMLKPCDEFMTPKDSQGSDNSPSNNEPLYALETYQVNDKVNSVRNDSAEFTRPWISSSNKQTLNRFFQAQATPKSEDTHDQQDRDTHTLPVQTVDIDSFKKVQARAKINHGQESPEKPYRHVTLADISKHTVKDEDRDDTMDDAELKEALELSLKDHQAQDPTMEGMPRDSTEDSGAARVLAMKDGAPSVDLLTKQRRELDQEDEEMRSVLEMSRIEAIAFRHQTPEGKKDDLAPLPEEDEDEALRKREQDELDRAIAASLAEGRSGEEDDENARVIMSSQPSVPSAASNSTSLKSSKSSTPRKRKISTTQPPMSPTPAAKKGKADQNSKITSFFQHSNPP